MEYKCCECGHIFEEGEQASWKEERGEFWGTPCSETMCGCPVCHGYFEETSKCAICGSQYLKEELNESVCDECIDEYRYDIDMCFNIGSEDTESVELNCFLISMFDRQEIEEILFKVLKEAQKLTRIDCQKFIECDRYWFAEKLIKEVKKNECKKK